MKYRRLSGYKIKKIIGCFCEDFAASKTASLLDINRNTVNAYYQELRWKIVLLATKNEEKFCARVELDESYFEARRVRGKRGRGATGKIPVFELLKRNGNVHVEVVKNCSKKSLLPLIKGKIRKGATLYTDGWKSYDGLILDGYKHYRIHHHHNEFARGKNHINGIESFWSFCKRRLAKFNGISNSHFLLHLKESEFRFNHRSKNLYPIFWNLLKKC